MAKKNSQRMAIKAPMPVKCPHCAGTDTVCGDGVHYNTFTRTRFEYRTCRSCGFKFVAFRQMTDEEIEERCK